MNFFLKMKHWQLFILFLLLPLAVEPLMAMAGTGWIGPVVNALLALLAVGYLWTLGSYLYGKAPKPLYGLSPGWFRAGLIYAFLDLVLLGIFANQLILEQPKSPYYIVPLHAIAMVGIFYAFYYIAKSLASIEKGGEANLNDFAGPFFMLWFFPIGIWFLQPRVNKVYEED